MNSRFQAKSDLYVFFGYVMFALGLACVPILVIEPRLEPGIGQQLLRILGDDSSFWDRTGVLPPAREPSPELKPFFTIKDAAQGTAYYVVTWTQVAADIGTTAFPTQTGSVNLNDGSVEYTEAGFRDLIASFIPAERDDA